MADFPTKYMNKVSADLKDSAQSMSDDELKKKIITFEHGISGVELAMANDTELVALQEELKDKKAPYQEDLTMYKSNIRYLIYIIESRGQAPVTP
jgi:hypothetical protein